MYMYPRAACDSTRISRGERWCRVGNAPPSLSVGMTYPIRLTFATGPVTSAIPTPTLYVARSAWAKARPRRRHIIVVALTVEDGVSIWPLQLALPALFHSFAGYSVMLRGRTCRVVGRAAPLTLIMVENNAYEYEYSLQLYKYCICIGYKNSPVNLDDAPKVVR